MAKVDSSCCSSTTTASRERLTSRTPGTAEDCGQEDVSGDEASAAFWCHSDVYLGSVESSLHKGLALDDTSFRDCPDKVPELWPNTLDVTTSLRLFKAWEADWPDKDRVTTWHKLWQFVEVNNAKVLVGTQVTCRPEADEQDWQWTKELLEMLGPEHVLGLAIGNEMDLLFSKTGVDPAVTEDCIREMWVGGRFWRMFSRRVAELDAMGFHSVAVTTVFGGLALDGMPFKENPAEALVTSFFLNASRAFGARYAFAFNFYPYFDPTLELDPNSTDQCSKALAKATCFHPDCSIPSMAARTRRKIQQITGKPNSTFWIGETGWSTPISSSLNTPLAECKEWSAVETFLSFYKSFLSWDMSIGGAEPPDHAFYFTARNSLNYGVPESFGLIETCEDRRCKLRRVGFMAPGEVPVVNLDWTRWAFAAIAGFVLISVSVAVVYVKLEDHRAEQERRRQDKEKLVQADGQTRTLRELASKFSSKDSSVYSSNRLTTAPSSSSGLATFASAGTVVSSL